MHALQWGKALILFIDIGKVGLLLNAQTSFAAGKINMLACFFFLFYIGQFQMI